jgi:hypothetical protein
MGTGKNDEASLAVRKEIEALRREISALRARVGKNNPASRKRKKTQGS